MKKLIAFAIAAGFSLAASAAPETYNIDTTHSFSRFEYSHFGYSNQVNKFNSTVGKIQIDRAAKTGSVEVSIDPKSVNTGYDTFNEHLQGADFLDSAKYPAITYKSTKFLFNGDKLVGVEGNLTISNHGYLGYAVIVNKKFWDGLPGDVRSQLEAAMKEATTYEKAIAQRDNDMALEAIRKSGKTQIYNLSAQEQAMWRNAMLPVQKQMEDRIGKDLIQAINRETAK